MVNALDLMVNALNSVCLQASNATSPSAQSGFGTRPGQFQEVGSRAASAGYGPGSTHAASQSSQGQMNPLLTDYGGLQYPGY